MAAERAGSSRLILTAKVVDACYGSRKNQARRLDKRLPAVLEVFSAGSFKKDVNVYMNEWIGRATVNRPALLLLLMIILIAGCSPSEDQIPHSEMARVVSPVDPDVDAFGMTLLTAEEISRIERLAASGDPKSVSLAIDTFLYGIGVPSDSTKVLALARAGTELGIADAEAVLGRLLIDGAAGVPADQHRGKELLQKAAAAGSERALLIRFQKSANDQDFQALLDFDRQSGIKRGDTAIAIALACAAKANATDQERRSSAIKCAKEWSARAATSAHLPFQISASLVRGEVAKLENRDSGQALHAHAKVLMEASELRATNRIEALSLAIVQSELSEILLYGTGVVPNAERAKALALKATEVAAIDSDRAIRVLRKAYGTLNNYHAPRGVDPDPLRSFGWLLRIKEITPESEMDPLNTLMISKYEESLSSEEKLRVQAALERQSPGDDLSLSQEERAPERPLSSGTAFLISNDGHALTNAHVIEACASLRDPAGAPARLLAVDETNDLAAIRFESYTSRAFAKIESQSKLPKLGDKIAVFGFPLNNILSSSGNLTAGEISAMSGLGNNSAQFQITAPIQPGSSGSPVLSMRGNVVGVVSATASTVRLSESTGAIGQNLNFAISRDSVSAFLRANGIPFAEAGDSLFSGGDLSLAEVGKEAQLWTIRITCHP